MMLSRAFVAAFIEALASFSAFRRALLILRPAFRSLAASSPSKSCFDEKEETNTMKFNTKKGGPAAAGGSERKSMKMEAD